MMSQLTVAYCGGVFCGFICVSKYMTYDLWPKEVDQKYYIFAQKALKELGPSVKLTYRYIEGARQV